MELLPKEVVFVIIRWSPLSTLYSLLLVCRFFSFLTNKDYLLPLLRSRIPHRNITNLTLPQVFNLCCHRPRNIAIGDVEIMFKKGGRAYCGHRNSQVRDANINDVVDVIPCLGGFMVLSKNSLTHSSGGRCEWGETVLPFDAIQVVNVRYENEDTICSSIVLSNEGVPFAVSHYKGDIGTIITPLTIVTPIMYMVGENDQVKLVDVDKESWLVLEVTQGGVIVPFPPPHDNYKIPEKRLTESGVKLTGVRMIYNSEVNDDMFFLEMEDNTIHLVEFEFRIIEHGNILRTVKRKRYEYFSF
jgi:hypothetical protein